LPGATAPHHHKQYQADQQFGRAFGLFTGLAIFVACLGLFGLATFTTQLRTKEIGVRKVLGASVAKIIMLLNIDYLKLMLIANVISFPAAWWALNEWLNNYAFRITLSPWLLILPGMLVFAIAILTVSTQTWKAANADPVKSLRYE
jgi:putative ABC transport system permease protein